MELKDLNSMISVMFLDVACVVGALYDSRDSHKFVTVADSISDSGEAAAAVASFAWRAT